MSFQENNHHHQTFHAFKQIHPLKWSSSSKFNNSFNILLNPRNIEIAYEKHRMHRLKAKKKGFITGLVSGMAREREREKRNPVGRGPATSPHFRPADRRRGKERVAPSLRDVCKTLSYCQLSKRKFAKISRPLRSFTTLSFNQQLLQLRGNRFNFLSIILFIKLKSSI